MAMVLLAMTGFVACGDDDDDNDTDSSYTGKGSGSSNGLMVTQVGEWSLAYNSNGSLASIGDEGGFKTVFNGNKMMLEYEDIQIDYGTVSYNSNGYISKFVINFEGEAYGEENASATYELSYNGDGQLSSVKASGQTTYYGDDEWGTSTGTTTMTLSYTGGNLTKYVIVSQEKGTRNNKSYTLNTNIQADFTYGSQTNKFRQLPYYVADEIGVLGDFSGPIACAGLLGKGPATLPASFTVKETDNEDGEVEEYTDTTTLTFELNEDGTIRSEKSNSNRALNYVYGGSSETRSAGKVQQGEKPQLIRMLPKLFRH